MKTTKIFSLECFAVYGMLKYLMRVFMNWFRLHGIIHCNGYLSLWVIKSFENEIFDK